MSEAHPRRRARLPDRSTVLSHLPFAVLFALGATLRVLVQIAYPQAYLINDSRGYVDAARTLLPQAGRQSGYAVFMRMVPEWHRLTTVTAVQHALGLVLAVAIYATLCRRVPRWAAALAAAPVLLDPFQLNLEHYILTDFLFEFLLCAGLLLLVWWRRTPTWAAAVAGALLGLSLATRGVGDLVVAVVVIVVAIGQARWRPALALLAAAVLPIAGYMTWYHHTYGAYSTGTFPAEMVYGRVMTAIDCRTLTLPREEQPLCKPAPVERHAGVDWYVWNSQSALASFVPPPGRTTTSVVADFDRRAIWQQPARYLRAIVRDVVKGFAPQRTRAWTNRAPDNWLFATDVKRRKLVAELTGDRAPKMHSGLAGWLTADNHLYVPGPVMGLGLLLALISIASLGTRRGGGQREAIALFALPCLLVLVTPAAVAGFSWRYQLPQIALLPPATVLAVAAVVRRQPGGQGLRESMLTLARAARPARGVIGGGDGTIQDEFTDGDDPRNIPG